MGLISSFRDISEGVVGYFTGKKGVSYPFSDYMYPFVFSAEEVKGIQENWMYNMGYAFAVVKNSKGQYSNYTQKDGDKEIFGEFKLNINPQNISMREPFAIDVVPTQTGVITQHSGSVIKEIVIAGTTGVHSKRGAGGVTNSNIARTLNGVFGGGKKPTEIDPSLPPDSQKNKDAKEQKKNGALNGVANFLRGGTGILNGEPPGFYHFHMLRNYIRSYVQCKTRAEFSDAYLVFRNKKDGEDWIVEPIDFTMERSARSPFTYNYRITLRALKRISITVDKDGGILGGFGRFLDTLETVENVIQTASDLINTGASILNASAEYINQLSQDFNTLVMSPVNAVANLLGGVRNASNAILAVPRSFVAATNNSVTNLIRRVEDVTGVGSNTYNTRVGRISTAKDVSIYRTPTIEEVTILKGLNYVQRGLIMLLATDMPFSKELINDSSYNIDAFNVFRNVSLSTQDKVSMKKGSIESIQKIFGNELIIQRPASAFVDVVRRDETLQDIAVRTLGDVSRWYDIAMLNQLKYPYIDTTEDKSRGVVAPGSRIYIPSSSKVINKGIVRGRTSYITKDMSEIEKSLGVDLELTEDNDLRVTPNQDLDVISGAPNAAQAIHINLMLEHGSLKYHPYKGVGLDVGTKEISTAQDILEDIKRSILTDYRFDSISNTNITRDNATVMLGMNVSIANLGREIPLQISV